MRILLPILLFSFLSLTAFSQTKQQIRLRLGATQSFISNDNNQAALYSLHNRKSATLSGFGLEYYHPESNWLSGIYTGVFLSIHPYAISINPQKFSVVPDSRTIDLDYNAYRFYAGAEKRIGSTTGHIEKNYFSVTAAMGLSYNAKGDGVGNWIGPAVTNGVTTDSKLFTGQFYNGNGNPLVAGYYSQIRAHRAATLSPDIAGGIRYNIQNKKGRTVVVAESVFTLGITTKYYMDVYYTLNGQSQMDRLKDKGTNLQLNLILPLWSFGKN